VATRWCGMCGLRPVRARGVCATCYAYAKRHGEDRSEDLMIAENTRRVEARMEIEALPAHLLFEKQRAQRPRLVDRVDEAYRERRARLRREEAHRA